MSKALWCFIGTALACAQAQDPPKVLRIIREDIKEGKSPAHESFVSVAETQAFEDKISEFETLDAVDTEYRSATSYSLAVHRPDLSFHGAELVEQLPKAR